MRPVRLAALIALAIPIATPAPAGTWFDVGAGYPVTVYATGDPTSWEVYPTYAFGPMPQGSLVYADVSESPCESLREPGTVCGASRFIRGFRLYFNGAGCGCTGTLALSTTIRLAYDPARVAASGRQESELRVIFNDVEYGSWGPVPNAVVHAEADYVEFTWARDVRDWREFAIVTFDITPVATNSWGRIKRLYR